MIKKLALVFTGFVLAVAIFGVVGFAYAQTQFPPDADGSCPDCGGMMRGGSRSGRGGMMGFVADGEYGPMHEAMITAFAEAFGLSTEELKARHDSGETMWQIAAAQGFSLEDFTALMLSARSTALAQAVTDGWLTQEQADWMQSRWEYMQANGFGPGSSTGTGPCHGRNFENGRGGRGRWSGNQ